MNRPGTKSSQTGRGQNLHKLSSDKIKCLIIGHSMKFNFKFQLTFLGSCNGLKNSFTCWLFSVLNTTFCRCENVIVCLAVRYVYHNDPKFLDRHVWANSVDPDQIAPEGTFWSGSTSFYQHMLETCIILWQNHIVWHFRMISIVLCVSKF